MTATFHSPAVVLLVGLFGIVAADFDNLESLASDFSLDRRLDGAPPGELLNEIFAARMCRASCGNDVVCQGKCPKPWKALVEACHQAPTVMACFTQCAVVDDACIKACPSFTVDWIQKKFEKDPVGSFSRAEKMCPRLEKGYACHQACVPGDFACHQKCPRVRDHQDHDWHPDHHQDEGMHAEKPVDSSSCELCLASGKDFCISESKCITRATFGCKGPSDHITGDRWFALHGNPEGIQHKMTCPASESKVEKEVPTDAKGCYDKGIDGVWCPKGDGWYCIKNCKEDVKKSLEPDANGCYDKGKYGVWCPKDGDWHCIKNCKEDIRVELHFKPDANGCYDKGKFGVWCPKDGDWYDANECFDKGEYGLWCPIAWKERMGFGIGNDWYCVKNCKEVQFGFEVTTTTSGSEVGYDPNTNMHRGCWLSAMLKMFYDTFKALLSDLPDLTQVSKEIVV